MFLPYQKLTGAATQILYAIPFLSSRITIRILSVRNILYPLIGGWLAGFLIVTNPCILHASQMENSMQKATFGAGCFWGIEKVFGELKGVISTQVGYTGGTLAHPTYEEVCTGRTGHAEALEITYDPARIRYEDLLEVFWRHHDPTTHDRQGPDIGSQYRSVIFYHSPEQKVAAEKSRSLLEQSKIFKNTIVTQIAPAETFYPAEEYHQKYLKKNPHGYCSLQVQSGKISEILRNPAVN